MWMSLGKECLKSRKEIRHNSSFCVEINHIFLLEAEFNDLFEKRKTRTSDLKVLSSEMDPAENRLIR